MEKKEARRKWRSEEEEKNNSISHMEFMIFYVNCGTRLEYYMRSHRRTQKHNTHAHIHSDRVYKQFTRKGHQIFCIQAQTYL